MRRLALCISPGTALSDQKRQAVLQQLLESPLPPPKKTKAVLDVGREKVERIVTPPLAPPPGPASEGNDDGAFEGFKFGGDTSSGFNFDNIDDTNNESNIGGGEMFSFGDGGAKNNDGFSFFGGGKEDDEGEGQGDGEGFTFSFGGGFDEEKGGSGGGFSLF